MFLAMGCFKRMNPLKFAITPQIIVAVATKAPGESTSYTLGKMFRQLLNKCKRVIPTYLTLTVNTSAQKI